MSFSVFINFSGNCREALAFYADVFGQKMPKIMVYKDAPPDPSFKLPDETKDWVMYAALNIQGTEVMFSDVPPGVELVSGNNISPIVSSSNMNELKTLFDKLKKGGIVDMELQETFWTKLYGMVTDKFGIIWQLNFDDGKMMK